MLRLNFMCYCSRYYYFWSFASLLLKLCLIEYCFDMCRRLTFHLHTKTCSVYVEQLTCAEEELPATRFPSTQSSSLSQSTWYLKDPSNVKDPSFWRTHEMWRTPQIWRTPHSERPLNMKDPSNVKDSSSVNNQIVLSCLRLWFGDYFFYMWGRQTLLDVHLSMTYIYGRGCSI